MQRAQRYAVGEIVRAVLAVPADLRSLDPDRNRPEPPVEATRRAAVGVGPRYLLGERGATPPPQSIHRSHAMAVSPRVEVKTDGVAD